MPQDNNILRVILPGKLIDGIGTQPQEGKAVAIQGNSIKWVGSAADADNLDSNGATKEIMEFPGGTLLAGLFDIHTHTNMPGDGRTGEQINLDDNDEIRLLRSARNAATAIASGVTTMCDCGSWNRTGFALKEGLSAGLVEGPRVLVSGPPLTVTGGHLYYMGGEADGVAEVRKMVRNLVKQGADFIKIAASGGSTSTSDPYRAAYSVDELKAIVYESHNRGRPVLAHCRCTDAINAALDADVAAILHCSFYDNDGQYRYDQETAERLAASEVYLTPTMGLGQANRARLMRIKNARGLTEAEKMVRDYAVLVTKRAWGIRDRVFHELRKHFSEAQIVELTMRIALTGMFNRINQALQIDMEDGVMPAFKARGLDVSALPNPT